MQTSLELFPTSDQEITLTNDPHSDVKNMLENYIKVCGLVAYKDFFIKIKYGQIEAIPDGVTKAQYLTIAREVFESRAGRIERQKGRAKFFAIKNKTKKSR